MTLQVIDPTVISVFQQVVKEKLRAEFDKIAANFLEVNSYIVNNVSSIWLFGTGAPTDVAGKDTDLYLDTATYDLYQKSAGIWALIGNLKGATAAVNAIVAVNGLKLTDADDTAPNDILTTGTVTISGKIATDTLAAGNSDDTVLMTPLRVRQHMEANSGRYPFAVNQDGNGKQLFNIRATNVPVSGALALATTHSGKLLTYTGAGDTWTVSDLVNAANPTDVLGIEIVNQGTGAITLSPTTVTINGATTIPVGGVCALIFFFNSVSLAAQLISRVS